MATFADQSLLRYLNDSENALPELLTGTRRTSVSSIPSVLRHYANGSNTAPIPSVAIQDKNSATSPSSTYDESVFSRQSRLSVTTATSHQTNPLNNTHVVLPCEFISLDCEVTFHIDDFENWLRHNLTHFNNLPPPSRCSCLFCDVEFEDNHNPYHNWRNRMSHSREHIIDGGTNIRPDFAVLQYMWMNGLMNHEDWTLAEKYTERPSVPGLVRKVFETPEAKLEREKESKVPHDLQREERDRKRSSILWPKQTSISSRTYRPVSIKSSPRT